jgi:transcriptional regulator with XRE-family HTH domain
MKPIVRRSRIDTSDSQQTRTDDLCVTLRARRMAQGLTLQDLARSIGLSKSAVSQIESGKIDPSLDTLRRLAQALKITLASLFETRTTVDDRMVHRHNRKIFHIPRNHLRYELLSPDLVDKRVEFLRVEFGRDGGEEAQPYTHEGEEYGIVIRGRVKAFVDGSTYALGPGDSIFFRAAEPHYIRRAGRGTAVMIWAISPPNY